MALSVQTKEKFARYIEAQVSKGLTYMEAVLAFCADKEIDPVDIVPLLTDKIRTAIGQEGQKLHLLPKEEELDI